jgi:DNA-binding response OmpR family regulator
MHRILVVTPDPKAWAAFAAALIENHDIQLAWAESGAAALGDVTRHPPLCVVVNESLPDMSALDLVRRLATVNAMVNTAVASGLADQDFHEASEGLGVLLRIPPAPGKVHAEALLARLERIGMLTG